MRMASRGNISGVTELMDAKESAVIGVGARFGELMSRGGAVISARSANRRRVRRGARLTGGVRETHEGVGRV